MHPRLALALDASCSVQQLYENIKCHYLFLHVQNVYFNIFPLQTSVTFTAIFRPDVSGVSGNSCHAGRSMAPAKSLSKGAPKPSLQEL